MVSRVRYLSSGAFHSPIVFFEIPQWRIRSSSRRFGHSEIKSTLKLLLTNFSSSSISSDSCSGTSSFLTIFLLFPFFCSSTYSPSSSPSSWSSSSSSSSSLSSSLSPEEEPLSLFYSSKRFFSLLRGSMSLPYWLYYSSLTNRLILRSSRSYI